MMLRRRSPREELEALAQVTMVALDQTPIFCCSFHIAFKKFGCISIMREIPQLVCAWHAPLFPYTRGHLGTKTQEGVPMYLGSL